jgi:hypothetical protein
MLPRLPIAVRVSGAVGRVRLLPSQESDRRVAPRLGGSLAPPAEPLSPYRMPELPVMGLDGSELAPIAGAW